MNDDFDKWNDIKKRLELNTSIINNFPQEGEVWMCSLGKNIGYEQNGSNTNFSRPTLIVKKFNNHMFWTIPLSTKQKDLDFYYNFTDPENRKVSIILAQMKLTSIRRLRRLLYHLPKTTLLEIKENLKKLLV